MYIGMYLYVIWCTCTWHCTCTMYMCTVLVLHVHVHVQVIDHRTRLHVGLYLKIYYHVLVLCYNYVTFCIYTCIFCILHTTCTCTCIYMYMHMYIRMYVFVYTRAYFTTIVNLLRASEVPAARLHLPGTWPAGRWQQWTVRWPIKLFTYMYIYLVRVF